MTSQQLKDLHTLATEARDRSHEAYEAALKTGDSQAAWQTLVATNSVRDAVYQALLQRLTADNT